jgi:serine/threonine-protein kinase
MGEVFEADDLETRERVVVKLLHADCTSDSYLDRMRLEAESLALLDHPNIVQVSRFSKTPDGRPYVAMERLEGGTLLHEVRARGALPCEEAVDCGVQILAGLSAAHNRGIVHRDIKPQNIFLCPPDANGKRIIKILDFGLAKTLEDVETSRRPAPLAYPTDVGTFVGTARYATPEQIRGQEVDARTDLYSTALVILTLLTGHQPYGDVQDQREILMAQLNRSPLQGESTLDSLPRPLIAVLEKALSKDIDQRFLTAIGLSDALRNSLTDDAVAISKSAAAVPDGAEPNGESAPVDEADAPPAGALMSIKLAAIVIASAIAFGLLTVVVLYWVGR